MERSSCVGFNVSEESTLECNMGIWYGMHQSSFSFLLPSRMGTSDQANLGTACQSRQCKCTGRLQWSSLSSQECQIPESDLETYQRIKSSSTGKREGGWQAHATNCLTFLWVNQFTELTKSSFQPSAFSSGAGWVTSLANLFIAPEGTICLSKPAGSDPLTLLRAWGQLCLISLCELLKIQGTETGQSGITGLGAPSPEMHSDFEQVTGSQLEGVSQGYKSISM